MKTLRLSLVASALALSLGLSGHAVANSTSSGIKGYITGPAKNPAAGTVITITHVPSGTSKQTTVNGSGLFSADGLRVGGPYTIKIDSDTFSDQTVNDVYLSLGESYQLNVALKSMSVERIEVTGQVVSSNYGSNSPSSHFDLSDLQSAPSVSRDIKDLVRIDPRVYVDESGSSNSIQCAGGSPRFNSLTVDGVRMNDNFGLNGNGYPTERIPFSFDAIDQVAVELAPFDVQYGGFTACNINAVTKSGTNEVTGSVFYDYTNESMKGDSIEGEPPIDLGNFSEKRYGFNIGLPIISDKLYIFAAYEKLDGSQVFQYDPVGDGIDQATIDQIVAIARDKYGYDAGSMVPSMPVEDEKLLLKLDWNISDDHRANLVYNYNDGFSIAQSDTGSSRLSLSNHFYERGAELNSIVGSIYSNWTDNFSTEVRIGKSKLDNRQVSIDQASGFGEFQVKSGNVTVYLGPDDSRQSNKLNYENWSYKFAGNYYFGDNKLSFGYEREELDVFNLFVQHTVGEYRFGSVEELESGFADRIYYGNAKSHNPNDAAGEFAYAANTVYVQDEMEFIDIGMTLTFGLRYEKYSSDDLPALNEKFVERYGFSNQQNLDGKDLFQPRVGVNWSVNDNLEVRGGFGLYSGGNPNVWISNSYSNDGIRNLQYSDRNIQLLGPDAVAISAGGNPGFDITEHLYDLVSNGSADSATNVTDPDFEIPSEWKYSLGMTYVTDSDYVFTADILLSRKRDSAIVTDLAAVQVGTAPDGRPLYDTPNHSRSNDFMLTNVKGSDGKTNVLSFGVTKSYDNGIKFSASYAYTSAKDVSPMTSSVAFSNYQNIAVYDQQNPELARSNYEIPHRFTLNLAYTHEYFDGYKTKFNLFGQANEGQPYTYSFTSDTNFGYFNDADRQLLYVPLENDPNVIYAQDEYNDQGELTKKGFDQAAFNQFIKDEGLGKYRGKVIPRNALDSNWWVKFDLRVEQEFAGFSENHKASAYFVLENVGNFLNDDWGVMKQGSQLQGAVDAEITADNKYQYNNFTSPTPQSVSNSASLWEMRLGVKYKF